MKLATLLLSLLLAAATPARAAEAWFEKLKAKATPEQLYRFLYALPKGGDLHNHLTGAGLSEWWWDAALAQAPRGYVYYTKVRIDNCVPYGGNEYSFAPYLILFRTIQGSSYEQLDACQKGEYRRLQDLNATEKQGWLDSIRLDTRHEGRNEFFGRHWERLNDLWRNPHVVADILLRNMQAFPGRGRRRTESRRQHLQRR